MIALMLSVLENMPQKSIKKEPQSLIGSEMSNIKKPTTVAMSDFKESFIQLLKGSELPAWVLLYIIEPYVTELRQVSK